MRAGFGRRRRSARDADGRSAIDTQAVLKRVIDEKLVPVAALEAVGAGADYTALAAVGRGKSEDGKDILVAVATRLAGDALLAALAAVADQKRNGEFDGEVYAIAPSWPSSSRRRLGLIGELGFPIRAVAAPVLAEGVGLVEPEPLESPPVVTAAQLTGHIQSNEGRLLFGRAADALAGLASKHGGAVRGSGHALELVLNGRRVAALRVDDAGTVLESIVPRRSSERLDTAGIAGALDRLEGQLRKHLNDKRVRSGEEGLRQSVLDKMIAEGELRNVISWPFGGQDIYPLDYVAIATDGRAVVGATRKKLDLSGLGNILDGLIAMRPFLSVVLAGTEVSVRLETPRLRVAATDFDQAAIDVIDTLALDVSRITVGEGAGREPQLSSAGESEAMPLPESSSERSRGGRGRGRGGRGRGKRSDSESQSDDGDSPKAGDRDGNIQEVSSFDLGNDEPQKGRERSRRRGRGGRSGRDEKPGSDALSRAGEAVVRNERAVVGKIVRQSLSWIPKRRRMTISLSWDCRPLTPH